MLSVIVPTLNERDNVAVLIDRVAVAFDRLTEDAELVFVDDASPDGTAEEVRRVAAARGLTDRVRVIERDRAPGLARAVLAGFAGTRGDVVAVMDADLSHPPELLPALLKAVRGGADMAVASRYVRSGAIDGWPLRRRILSRGACMLARGLTPVRDATSGCFAVRRDAVDLATIRPRGYKIALELMARLPDERVTEVPFTFSDRQRGESKLGRAVMVAYLIQLAALYRLRFPLLIGYAQFSLVGLGGLIVDTIVFVFAFHAFAVQEVATAYRGLMAQTVSFVAAAAFSFSANAAWTFRDRSLGARFHRFLAVSAVGFVLRSVAFQALMLLPFMARAGGGYWPAAEMIALVCAIVAASLWNYYGSFRWAFRGDPRPAPEFPQPAVLLSNARAVAVLGAAGLLLALFAALTPLAHDEAYYWQWSRHLAWGYYDHPPMIAYLIAAGTRLLGNNELGVRIVPLIIGLTVPWCSWALARRYFESGVPAAWALGAIICMPLFGVGIIIATPDTPLVACWALAILLVIRALERGRVTDWLLAGAVTGLGLLSKYPMVLMFPVILCTLLATPRGRSALAGPGPWLAVLVSAVVVSPFLAWLVDQTGAGLLFQLRHGLGPAAGDGSLVDIPGLEGLGRFVAGQFGVISPILFALVLVALARAGLGWMRATPPVASLGRLTPEELRPLLIFGTAIPLTVFGAASVLATSEANWPAPAYITAAALLGGELARVCRSARPVARWSGWAGVSLAAVLSLYVHVETSFPVVAYRGGVLTQTHGHRELAASVQRMRGDDQQLPILASDYKLASLLAFYMPDNPEVCVPLEEGSGSAYYAWQPQLEPGTTALYVSRGEADELPVVLQNASSAGTHVTYRKGQPVREVYAYRGTVRSGICASGN